VRGIVALLEDDGAFDPNEDLARNSLKFADTMDGVLVVSGQLVGETALGVREAIEVKADELWRRFRDDHVRCAEIAIPPRPTLRALALAELLRAGHAVDLPVNWCDSHHLDPWERGGRTDVARLAALCRHHHSVTHRTGWQMHATDDGWFYWVTPTGRTFWSQRRGHRRRGPTPPEPG
jgi:hypothetical protein